MSGHTSGRPTLDERDRSIGIGVRAAIEVAPALTLDEVRARAAATPPSPRTAPSRSPMGWRLAAAAAVVVVLVGVVVARQDRSGDGPGREPAAEVLLSIPADPTGPAAAANTGSSTGEPDRSVSARWDVVRTGADDRQLIVHFSGVDACTTGYRAEVTETTDAVAITVHPVPRTDLEVCPAISAPPGAIGIDLQAPLGDRRLDGSRAIVGNDVSGALVVPGEELATITWPAGSERATTEQLGRALGPRDWVWTQTFTDPSVVIEPEPDSSDMARTPSISLEQWHGATPIDDGAGVQACRLQQPRSIEDVEVGGVPATLVRCQPDGSKAGGGSIAVLWMDEAADDGVATRFMLSATARSIDVEGLLSLAATVRRGG